MQKKMTKLFIGVTVLIAIVMSFGCPDPSGSNTKLNDQKIIESILDQIRKDSDLSKQFENLEITIENKAVKVSGKIYGTENLRKLIDIIQAEIAKSDGAVEYIIFYQLQLYACDEPGMCACSSGCVDCAKGCFIG